MENIFVEKTNKTPEVIFDFEKGLVKIEGRSIPEHPQEFFEKIENEIEAYQNNKFKFEINLEYFNSSSSKYILHLLNLSKNKFSDFDITWYVDSDDHDTLDFVENVEEVLKHKIQIIKYD